MVDKILNKTIDFMGGLNTLQHPTMIQDNEMQNLNNLITLPETVWSGGVAQSNLALTCRPGYKRLHSDDLGFVPKSLVTFRVSRPTTANYYQAVDDTVGVPNDGVDYIFNSSINGSYALFGFPVFSVSGSITNVQMVVRAKIDVVDSTKLYLAFTEGETIWNIVVTAHQISVSPSTGWATYTVTWTTNPATGSAWTVNDVNGIGTHPLKYFGFYINSTGASVQISQLYIHCTASGGNQDRLPTSDVTIQSPTSLQIGGSSITNVNQGSLCLVTGGYNQSTGDFETRYLVDETSTTSSISAQASSDTRLVQFFRSISPGGYSAIYYTDGSVAWRKWDGVADQSTTMTTTTQIGTVHKNTAFYGYDVTNNLPHRLYYSNVGQPETFGVATDPASGTQYFDIGDPGEAIIALTEQIDRLIIQKEASTWFLYFNAGDPVNSMLVQADPNKGSVSPQGSIISSNGQLVTFTNGFGWQALPPSSYMRSFYQPIALPIFNMLRGSTWDTQANMGYNYDQVWLASFIQENIDGTTPRVFVFDHLTEKCYKLTFTNPIYLSTFCRDHLCILTFDWGPKVGVALTTTTGALVEFDHFSESDETTIACYAQTKDFTFDLPDHRKAINYTVLEFVAADASTSITMKTYADGVLKETKSFTPTAAGWTRWYQPLLPSTTTGNRISFDFSYNQPQSNTRFALLKLCINYTIEPRAE